MKSTWQFLGPVSCKIVEPLNTDYPLLSSSFQPFLQSLTSHATTIPISINLLLVISIHHYALPASSSNTAEDAPTTPTPAATEKHDDTIRKRKYTHNNTTQAHSCPAISISFWFIAKLPSFSFGIFFAASVEKRLLLLLLRFFGVFCFIATIGVCGTVVLYR